MKDIFELEKIIGYQFQDRSLLQRALTHSSFDNECRIKRGNNERLEFLGDAVLELVSSEFLYQYYPNKPEGDMTKLRASLVCETSLAECARTFDLGSYLLLGRGEENNGGRKRDSVVSDALEAIIGATYLDGGYEPAKKFVLKYILTDIENRHLFSDSKTILQEVLQKKYTTADIEYCLVGQTGPEHDKTFHVELRLKGDLIGTGEGHTKKAAEMKAAYNALIALKGKEGTCI